MTTLARYDEFADWYVDFASAWDVGPLALAPDGLAGQRVLDLACGHGQLSRHLARLGAQVTGVDISTALLGRAAGLDRTEPLGIRYLTGDVCHTSWWDGAVFDGVVCHMALMDIDDLEGALRTARAVVAPTGWFSFSLFHPCYPGGWDGSPTGLPSWPPGGYAQQARWTTNGDGVRGRVGANHRMLSTYLNAVLRAGFEFEVFYEPPLPLPIHLAARCRPARSRATAGS